MENRELEKWNGKIVRHHSSPNAPKAKVLRADTIIMTTGVFLWLQYLESGRKAYQVPVKNYVVCEE